MKNIFKRKMILLSILSLIIVSVVGCTSNSNKDYTKDENKLINFANSQISEIYNVDINKEGFDYSVGKQVDKNKFDKLYENDSPKIVVVTACKFRKLKKGEVLNYVFMYNTQTNEIISSDIEII